MIRKAIIVVLTLAAVGTAAAHVSSEVTYRHFTIVSSRHASLGITAHRGKLRLAFLNYLEEKGPCWTIEVPIWNGFDYRRFDFGNKKAYWALSFPTWSAIASFATYPIIALVGVPLRRWRRRSKGQCRNCVYDLTGNESGVCPECGES